VGLLLLLVPLVSAQTPPLSFEALVEGDIPAWGLSDRLDVCLEKAEALEEERDSAESARRARLHESQTAAALARTNEIIERLTRDPRAKVDPGLLKEVEQELEVMFPSSEELRYETCQVLHERALRRLEIVAHLESCYRTAFADLGVGHLAPPEVEPVAAVRAAAIRGFTCSREVQPMATGVELAPAETVVLTASTVCLEAELSRPGDGEPYAVAPDPVTPEILELLRAAAADPATLADVQEAVWSGKPRTMIAGSGRGFTPGGSTPLADAAEQDRVKVVATIHDGFSLVDLVLSNPTPDPVSVTLTGTRLEPKGGGGGSQSLGMAGVNSGSPPRAPSLESREERLARALRHARERLENAIERVRNGDHSPEALRELLEALREAEALGLDGDEAGEALQEEGFDALVDGAYERAEESYKVWEHDPTDANRRQALEDFRAVEQVGGPPDDAWDDYGQKLEKLAGE
jgi:hypothetical protein